MRLSQTVLTALVATSATALPVTENQPTGEQQQQQVSSDHDGVQSQKFGKLEETAHKQPLGYNNNNNNKEVGTEKKNSGSFNGLFTTNGQKESQGWAKIKSALSRGNSKQDDKLDSRRPTKGEFTDGNRQHGSNGIIQARHDSNEGVRLEKMTGGDRQSIVDSGDMGFIGHEQYLDKSSNRPFRGEYIAPREIKKNGGDMIKDDMTMNMDTTMPSQEREEWMRGGRGNGEWMRPNHGNDEWMRHGEESEISKSRGQDKDFGMNKLDSDRRQGQYKDEFVTGQYRDELVKGQKESRSFSPMTQSWIVRFNNDATKDGKVPMLSSDEQIAGTVQMTYVDDRTPEQQHRELPNHQVKENRMLPNRVPHTYEPEMRRPWNEEDERQYNEYLNKGKPMSEQSFEHLDRQPNNGESKQFLNYQPTSETKENLDHQPASEHGLNFSSEPTSGEVKEFVNYQPVSGETREYRDRQPTSDETKEMLNSKPLDGQTKQYLNYQPISGETKEYRDRQPTSGETKEMLNSKPLDGQTKQYLSYQPISGETKEMLNSKPLDGQIKQYLNYQPISGETKEYRDRQPTSGETKEMIGTKPIGGDTRANYNDQSGRTRMDMNQPSDGIHHTTDNTQKDSFHPEGEFQTAPYMSQKSNYRVVSSNNGNIQRRNRHTGTTQNSQVLPPSQDMSRDGSARVPLNEESEKLTEREYTRPHTWMITDPSIFGDDFLEPLNEKNMVKDGKMVEARELYKTYEHGEPMHKDFKLMCDAEGGFLCESVKDNGMPYEKTEMMKGDQLKGSPKEGLVDSQRQGHDQDKTFFEHNPTKGTNNNN